MAIDKDKQRAFKRKCERVADKFDNEVLFFTDEYEEARADEFEAVYDDGSLHIRRYGIRAVFELGEDRSIADQNANTRLIMEALNMKRKINDQVLLKEEPDDEPYEEEEFDEDSEDAY